MTEGEPIRAQPRQLRDVAPAELVDYEEVKRLIIEIESKQYSDESEKAYILQSAFDQLNARRADLVEAILFGQHLSENALTFDEAKALASKVEGVDSEAVRSEQDYLPILEPLQTGVTIHIPQRIYTEFPGGITGEVISPAKLFVHAESENNERIIRLHPVVEVELRSALGTEDSESLLVVTNSDGTFRVAPIYQILS